MNAFAAVTIRVHDSTLSAPFSGAFHVSHSPEMLSGAPSDGRTNEARHHKEEELQRGKVTAPVLVVHGENDAVVPVTLGERLYRLIAAPKRFIRIARAGHNDLGARSVAAAKRFIAEQ